MQVIDSKIWSPVFQEKEWTFQPNSFLHPCHASDSSDWEKFRLVQCGGREFVDKYLEKFSKREDSTDFSNRKKITYNPGHAKNAVTDVKNAIHQRLVDVTRKEGEENYKRAMNGLDGGVNLAGSTMNRYFGNEVLPELLFMSRVGVYIDKPRLPVDASRADTQSVRPYLYTYRIEDILSWSVNRQNKLTHVLLRDTALNTESRFGLTTGTQESFRLLRLTEDGKVELQLWGTGDKVPIETVILNLSHIPFAHIQISHSLLQDTADYQISMLNLASSDINYAFKSNYPFYTEQFEPRTALTDNIRGGERDGTAAEGKKAGKNEIKVGAAQGRGYPKGLDRPGFIHPSSEPLMASMKKQEQLKTEIRELTDLALSQVTSSSAESKAMDERGMEAGLSAIGLELEMAENFIAFSWAEYEGESQSAEVKYPKSYSLQSDKQRREEADDINKLKDAAPSMTYKKELSKQQVRTLLGNKLSQDEIDTIEKEIDDADVVETDAETIKSDHEAGFVSTDTASKIRGYPEGETAKAKLDHAERIARIAEAQGQAAGARGVDDLSANPDEGDEEKNNSQDPDGSEDGSKKTRD